MNADQLLLAGGRLLGHVGVQQRPVIELNGQLYEKAIEMDDGLDHSEMYEVPEDRAAFLRRLLASSEGSL